jgi:uncharacterized Fe-S cluster protein YjdI/CDGSH-type Zn-finger protein
MQAKKYSGEGIDVYYEPRLCIHAARCVAGLPHVFDPAARPWIQPHNAGAEELSTIVEQCPTGALHYVRADGASEAAPAEARITIVKNGPMYVHGDINLQLPDGTSVRHDTRLALCRCGHSTNRPYCDNSHVAAKFEG